MRAAPTPARPSRHRPSRRRGISGWRGAGGATALLLVAWGCGGSDGDGGTTGPPDPDPGPSARSYAMGWAPGAPRPDDELVLAVIDSMAAVSDVTLLQQAVPWTGLLAGVPLEDLLDERVELATFLRSRGLEIVFLVDPLDGLDRTREPPELVRAGRSLREPGIRALHESWVEGIAREIRPEWMGLASEINTLAARGDAELYAEIVSLVNTLAPRVRELSPGSRVFVSFQADEANGTLVDPLIDHFALIDDFDIDALGLSSYPVFAFDTPEQVPESYFDPFDEATDLPLLMVEGGWSSGDVPWADGTPQEQVAYYDRYEILLDRIDARLWVGLTPTDLDVDALGLPPDRAQGLSNFALMGIWDVELERKPAFDAWARIFARPLP